MVCFAERELPLVFLWRCDTPLVTHMDLKKSTYKGLSMIYETRGFFSLKIISSYVGCGINIRRGKNLLKTDI